MRNSAKSVRKSLFLGVLLSIGLAQASLASPFTDRYTEARFRAVAVELAQKVDLFQEVWRIDPEAVFTAGVVRDFLYFVRVRMDETDPSKLEELLALPTLTVREFLRESSDIDLLSEKGKTAFSDLQPARFGFDWLDLVPLARFQPGTAHYQTEIHQGFLPIEKLMLSRTGLNSAPGFGDGFREIYLGRPSISIPTDLEFSNTHYVKTLGINHLVLLALRFVRTQSLNFVKTGGDFRDLRGIQADLDRIPDDTLSRLREIAASTRADLGALFQKTKFFEWYVKGLDRAFRGGGSATYSAELFRRVGLDSMLKAWPKQSPSLEHYVGLERLLWEAKLVETMDALQALYFRCSPSLAMSRQEAWEIARSVPYLPFRYWVSYLEKRTDLTPDERGILAMNGMAALIALNDPDGVWLPARQGRREDYFRNLIPFPLDPKLVEVTRAFHAVAGVSVPSPSLQFGWRLFWLSVSRPWTSDGWALNQAQRQIVKLLRRQCNSLLQR